MAPRNAGHWMRLSEILGPGIDLLMFPVFINHLPHRQITQHRIQFHTRSRNFPCVEHLAKQAIDFGGIRSRIGIASGSHAPKLN